MSALTSDRPPAENVPPSEAPLSARRERTPARLLPLAIGALGVVYGDIGTNPLFALKECFHGPHPVAPTHDNVLGVLSLVFWALIGVVTVKYLALVMRAHNDGEGGTLALLALLPRARRPRASGNPGLLAMVILFGSALLFGDGIVTPAISVLSAVEGVGLAIPAAKPFAVYATAAILVVLFLMQRRGTHRIGAVFGPVMVVWFAVIGALGLPWIVRHATVLHALNPAYAARLLVHGGWAAFLVLGAIVLVVAGGEALYADMGHFGRKPISLAWYCVVLPCLLLNYFGQGAFVLENPSYADSTFYALVPRWGLFPMILLATAATVIASQALISGAFSLTRQAVQLGYWPRVTIVHTSAEHEGQIYVPEINALLMVACITLVLAFKVSDALAAAYGLAVTGTMLVTSIAFFEVARTRWRWPLWTCVAVLALFLSFDVPFLVANLPKIGEGGWVPLVVGALMFALMTTWTTGRARLFKAIQARTLRLEDFIGCDEVGRCHRIPGTAVFLTANPSGIPPVLRHHVRHNRVLHEDVILLSIATSDAPLVAPDARVSIEELRGGFWRVVASYGFMETPNVPAVLTACVRAGNWIDVENVTYYLGRETILGDASTKGMARWRRRLFAYLARNAQSATAFFGIPADKVVEVGIQLDL